MGTSRVHLLFVIHTRSVCKQATLFCSFAFVISRSHHSFVVRLLLSPRASSSWRRTCSSVSKMSITPEAEPEAEPAAAAAAGAAATAGALLLLQELLKQLLSLLTTHRVHV